MKKEVKSQAALEFLTTYAWAFIAILIVVGALYYFGVFEFSKYLPQKCLFPSQFECIDFSFSGDSPYGQINDVVKFKLANNIGEELRITFLEATNDAGEPLTCTAPALPLPLWSLGTENEFVFTSCQDGVFIEGERTEAKITLKYCATATSGCVEPCVIAAGCPEHTINGKIIAVVNPP